MRSPRTATKSGLGGAFFEPGRSPGKGTSPVAWRNVNLIGNFDFTTSSSPVDIDALAAHYENEDFWRRSVQEREDDGIVSDAN